MWDKKLDEGIFLCDHNSHILTADLLTSLSYVRAQLESTNWIEPNEFLLNETDLISYILLKQSKELSLEVYRISEDIPLSNRRKNDIFQCDTSQDYGFWQNNLFIDKLFEQGAKLDSICARCHAFINLWEDECKRCIEYEYYEDNSWPEVGAINCDTCEGFYLRFQGKPITFYCEYNLKTKIRSTNNCKECDEHFDWLEQRIKE